MNFIEYWNKGKIYQHDAQLPECKNCEGVAAEYAWNDCKDEILCLIDDFNKEVNEKRIKEIDHMLFLLREKIRKEI